MTLKEIEFDYREEKSQIFGAIYRPVAKVKLMSISRKQWVTEFFYVDSGADFTLIPYKMGRFLGFKAENNDRIHEVEGINGVVGVIPKKAMFMIGSHEFAARVGWAQIEHVPMLLGRADVFTKFDVSFKEKDLKLVFGWRGE